mmetsp:Transcript_28786/g.73671  ORF Transcript_28786/g.73671 Transcript_28786/m.73671 type:complete len:323 (-) Transcript_28786:3156-4124(-)
MQGRLCPVVFWSVKVSVVLSVSCLCTTLLATCASLPPYSPPTWGPALLLLLCLKPLFRFIKQTNRRTKKLLLHRVNQRIQLGLQTVHPVPHVTRDGNGVNTQHSIILGHGFRHDFLDLLRNETGTLATGELNHLEATGLEGSVVNFLDLFNGSLLPCIGSHHQVVAGVEGGGVHVGKALGGGAEGDCVVGSGLVDGFVLLYDLGSIHLCLVVEEGVGGEGDCSSGRDCDSFVIGGVVGDTRGGDGHDRTKSLVSTSLVTVSALPQAVGGVKVDNQVSVIIVAPCAVGLELEQEVVVKVFLCNLGGVVLAANELECDWCIRVV